MFNRRTKDNYRRVRRKSFKSMPYLNSPENNNVSIFFEDIGEGQPVILIHGWPLSHQVWESQKLALLEAGYRIISYDRRGFGNSDRVGGSYDYSTLTKDLHALIVELELDNVVLVGFSMGGGEVVRYFTDFGDGRISKAVLISSIIPLVPEKPDNKKGVPEKVLNQIMDALKEDRVGFLQNRFVKDYYDTKKNDVSDAYIHHTWAIAANASAYATLECAKAWGGTDFREECQKIKVPTLIIHGTGDQIVPIETAGDQAAELIPNNRYEKIKKAPHGLNVTHKEECNKILLDFLKS
jgi:pimeloyl-ACP methyl ester carboxylesterase